MKSLYSLVICVLFATGLEGQIVYTSHFTHTLEKAGIQYTEPVEQWLHATVPPDHEYMDYDLVLQNDRNDLEYRYRIESNARLRQPVPASVEVSRLLASIASNDPEANIVIKIPGEDFLRQAFNADHGMIAYFTPQAGFSEKPYGALLSLYAAGHPAVDVLILSYDRTIDPLQHFRSVYFGVKPAGE